MISIETLVDNVSLTNLLLCILLILLIRWYYPQSSRLPPGPRGVPFLGYAPFLNPNAGITFNELAKKYGQIFSVSLGAEKFIIFNDYESIRKTLLDLGDIFSGRPTETQKRFHSNGRGLAFTDGPGWKEQRRFASSTLRDFGMGKQSVEPKIQHELQCLLKELEKSNGKPINVLALISQSFCNNICTIAFGNRFEYSDPEFSYCIQCVERIFQFTSNVAIFTIFPWLRNVPFLPELLGENDARNAFRDIDVFIKKIIDRSKANYTSDRMEGYIDAFTVKKAEIEGKAEKAVLDRFDDETLVIDLRVLFFSGTETSTTTLRWGLLYLMAHPDMQAKIQQEIADVIGNSRMPSMEDRPRMPYTEAFIMEVHRCCCLVPLGFTHRVLQDVEVNGYLIPKEASILTNLWAVHHDPKLWPDPDTFRPERFLNEKGDQAVKPDYLIPFGLGKRYCLGEPLARMELFLYVVGILQKFNIRKPEGTDISLDCDITVVRAPKPFLAHLDLREE